MIGSVRRMPRQSDARRSVYSELPGRPFGRRNSQPKLTELRIRIRLSTPTGRQKRLIVIVINHIMAMDVHRPVEVFFEPM